MKKYIILVLIIIVSCSKKSEEKIKAKKQNIESKAYFEFDEITQYYFPYTDEQLAEISVKETQSSSEKDLIELLTYDSPKTIEDANFIKRVEKLKPKVIQIESRKFQKIREIFSERARKMDDEVSSCKPEYRNILVFKKNGKVTGITKLCFNCGRVYIVGTNKNTNNFGNAGDWERLKRLIYNRPTANSR